MSLGLMIAAISAASPPPAVPRALPVLPLASLTAAQARALDGQRYVFRVGLDSAEDAHGDWTLYDCKSDDAVLRTVWLPEGSRVADDMRVTATLRVIRHPKRGDFGGFTEYRLICEPR